MMLGQPETAAEMAAYEAAVIRRQNARADNLQRAVVSAADAIDSGATLEAACLKAARAFKLGKGGARVLQERVTAWRVACDEGWHEGAAATYYGVAR